MKRSLLVITFVIALFAAACGPARVEPIEEIGTHETAFVVPLEGSSKDAQQAFNSISYLEERKAATKRIVISIRERSTGRMPWDYEWIPTIRVIRVNRSPVTREWVADPKKGTSNKDEALCVESLDSIGFCVGVNITALIAEEDAAKFLYYFPIADPVAKVNAQGQTVAQPVSRLAQVIDSNVRGSIQSKLASRFGKYELEECKAKKGEIFVEVLGLVRAEFLEMGITITNMGLADGLIYDDPAIQVAINARHVAEMDAEKAKFETLAQRERNIKKVEEAEAERKAAQQFALAQKAAVARVELEIARVRADADLVRANKWNGQLPANILPEGSSLLFGLPTASSK